MSSGLFDLVRASFEHHAARPCLEVADESFTYAEVGNAAAKIGADLDSPSGSMVGILASRSRTAYTGILGVLAVGCGYVPLHPAWPVARLANMVQRAGVREIVVGEEGEPLIGALAAALGDSVRMVVPTRKSGGELPDASSADPGNRAYIMFTSGTTGRPKAVPVRHCQIRAHLQAIAATVALEPADRCSQFFDLTFDPSLHDIFLTWMAGACLCVVPEHAQIAPAGFIRDRELTSWYSVPSVAVFLQRLRRLQPNAFDGLRLTRFGGEALLDESARAWKVAAPQSAIENMYGPTECTATSMRHVWGPDDDPRNGIVPIGAPVGDVVAMVRSPDGSVLEGEQAGELFLSGSQVTDGYLDDDVLTADRYLRLARGRVTTVVSDRRHRRAGRRGYLPLPGARG